MKFAILLLLVTLLSSIFTAVDQHIRYENLRKDFFSVYKSYCAMDLVIIQQQNMLNKLIGQGITTQIHDPNCKGRE